MNYITSSHLVILHQLMGDAGPGHLGVQITLDPQCSVFTPVRLCWARDSTCSSQREMREWALCAVCREQGGASGGASPRDHSRPRSPVSVVCRQWRGRHVTQRDGDIGASDSVTTSARARHAPGPHWPCQPRTHEALSSSCWSVSASPRSSPGPR